MTARRHRKPLSALMLGVWLFALFVSTANACMPVFVPGMGTPEQASNMAADCGEAEHQTPSASCLQFCADDTPVFSKLQLIQDQPGGQPLLISGSAFVAPPRVPSLAVHQHAHPPPGVPVLLRSLRLAL